MGTIHLSINSAPIKIPLQAPVRFDVNIHQPFISWNTFQWQLIQFKQITTSFQVKAAN